MELKRWMETLVGRKGNAFVDSLQPKVTSSLDKGTAATTAIPRAFLSESLERGELSAP